MPPKSSDQKSQRSQGDTKAQLRKKTLNTARFEGKTMQSLTAYPMISRGALNPIKRGMFFRIVDSPGGGKQFGITSSGFS